jgi:multidrug efflux pump subunit AcrA (membrane-fusion protein)
MRRDKRWWWAGGAVAALGLVAIVMVTSGDGGAVPTAAATSTVQRGTVSAEVSAAGTVQSASTRGLSFGTAGTVTELNVRAGDLVTEGQVLARIDPADAQAAVDSAANRVDDAAQALSKAQQTAALPPCTTAAPTTAAPTIAAPTIAAPTIAAATPGPSGSPAQPSQPAQPRVTATTPCTSRVATSDPLLSAEQQYNNAQLSLTQAQARLAGTTITAPVAGRVLSVGGSVGSRVSPGGTGFVVLGDVSALTVRAEFTEADVGRLAVGQVAAITLPDRLEPVSGTVSQIDPAGTITNRLVRYGVVIAFDTVPESVLLGQSATVLVTTQSVENVLYVASAAVMPTGDGVGTVTVRADGQDQTRTVRFGLRGDQYTEVSDGLSEGEVLVIP